MIELMIAAMCDRTVTPSLILKKLAAYRALWQTTGRGVLVLLDLR